MTQLIDLLIAFLVTNCLQDLFQSASKFYFKMRQASQGAEAFLKCDKHKKEMIRYTQVKNISFEFGISYIVRKYLISCHGWLVFHW